MKLQTTKEFLNQKTKEFFKDDILTESEYRGLDKREKREVEVHAALTEYVSLKSVMQDFFSKKMADAERDFANMSNVNSRFYKDVVKSAGDFSRTEQYKNIQSLLSYSNNANDANGKGLNGAQTDGQRNYGEASMIINRTISSLVSKSTAFKQAIARENILPLEKRVTFTTYLVLCYLIYSTTDLLYASSLKADFDYNQKRPVATNIYFEYNGGLDSQLQYLSYFNENFNTGTMNKLVAGALTESFEEAANDVLVIHENVLDVVAKLVIDSRVGDILLMPIYLLREIIYVFKYLKAYFTNMSESIESSIKLQRSISLTKDDYEQYKSKADNKLFAVGQAAAKAQTAIELEANSDKKSLNTINSTNGNILI